MNTRRLARIAAAASTFAAGSASAAYVTHTLTLPDAVVEGANLSSNSMTVATDYGKSIVSVKAVGLQASDGEFVRCKNGGGGAVYADQPDIATHEMFIMMTFSDGTVSFRARNGSYFLRANNGGGQGASCEATGIGQYSRWTPYLQADGSYALKSSGGKYLGIESDDDMIATATTIGSTNKWTIVDLGAAGMDATPDVRVQFKDTDGDGSEEMVLMLTMEDGDGVLMLDPMGIADTLNQLGYPQPNNNAFWDALSITQRATLRAQANAVGNYGQVISGGEIKQIIHRFDAQQDREYETHGFSVVVDSELISSTGECNGDRCDHVAIGDTYFSLDDDGIEINGALFSATVVDGPVTTEVEVMGGGVASKVTNNSITLGAELDLISVSVTVGSVNGTYAGISASAGEGFWVDVAAGRNGQYGFTLDLPVFPVGVCLYVKGSDAVWLWDHTADWFVGAANTTANLAENAWNSSLDWAGDATHNIAIAVSNTADDTMATVQVAGDNVVAAINDGTDQVLKIYEDAAGAVVSTLNDFTDTAEDMFNGVSGAVEDLGNAIGNAASDAGNFFCGIFGC